LLNERIHRYRTEVKGDGTGGKKTGREGVRLASLWSMENWLAKETHRKLLRMRTRMGWLTLQPESIESWVWLDFPSNCPEVEGLLGHQFGTVAEEKADSHAPRNLEQFPFIGQGR
jgi:hypothetical protein